MFSDLQNNLIQITEQNKTGIYLQSPIKINVTKEGIVDNSIEIEKMVNELESWATDRIENTLDLDILQSDRKAVGEWGKYLTTTRKTQTSQFKDTVANYTAQENRIKDIYTNFRDQEKKIQEVEFKKREVDIKKCITDFIAEQHAADYLSLDMFVDFISKKRETNIYTTTGKLSKTIKDAVEKVVMTAFAPIQEKIELKTRQEQQQKQFESYIENIETNGTTDKLEANKVTLIRFVDSIEEFYPDIVDQCKRSIKNKIDLIDANIKANKAESAYKEERDIDKDLLDEAHKIVASSENYDNKRKVLQEIYKKLQKTESKDIVAKLGQGLKKDVVEVKLEETKEVIEVEETKEVQFFIDIKDLEDLALEPLGTTKGEAKKNLIEAVAFIADNIDFLER